MQQNVPVKIIPMGSGHVSCNLLDVARMYIREETIDHNAEKSDLGLQDKWETHTVPPHLNSSVSLQASNLQLTKIHAVLMEPFLKYQNETD